MKLILSAVFSAYLLAFPSRALSAAREAMALWANAVAPALFPFMALLPTLSGEQARSAYARAAGRVMRALFRLPPEAASSVVVGWIAGSPAGAMAVARAHRAGALDSRDALIAGVLASGCGPVFVVSTVGAAMFQSAAVGARLLASMWASVFLTGMLLSRLLPAGRRETLPMEIADEAPPSPVREAVLGTASICGWMILFRVIADALPAPLQPFLEVSSGCAAAAGRASEPLAAFLCGFGGVCAMCQNLSALSACGVRAIDFAAGKLAAGALSAAVYCACEGLFTGFSCPQPDAMRLSAAVGACASIPIFVYCGLKRRKTAPKRA